MKSIKSAMFTLLIVFLLAAFGVSHTHAQSQQQCLCHNVQNNPVEFCSDDGNFAQGHQNHLASGFDTLGTCIVEAEPSATPTPTTPVPSPTDTVIEPTGTTDITPEVPEFGLLTGLATLAMSTGSYFMLKRKV